MEFFNVLKKRRSVRAFTSRPIEESKIRQILEASNSAPSAGNLQSYEIFLVVDEKKKRELALASFAQSFVAEAPLVLVFCANPVRAEKRYGKRGRNLYCIQDATIAATYAQLAAVDLGLASCWVGAFDEKEILRILGNPADLIPVAVIPIGYPAEEPKPTSRRKLEELVKRL
ncbi:MAG: nitroreductase family protein [Candidatus Aenigmatarchaeota archaeon]